MKNRVIFISAAIFMAGSLFGNSQPDHNPVKKPIQAVVEFFPNYVGHLLGVAQIGYNSEYADTYGTSVKADDLKYLQSHASLLKDDNGEDGILGSYFITFPCYVNPASKPHLGEYLTDLNSAIVNRSFDEFKEKYRYYIRELDRWNGFTENPRVFEYANEIQKISQILINNYDEFREVVWPLEYDRMEKLCNALNEKFNEWDLIKCWEECTGVPYDGAYYRIVLSTGMANGPTSQALGYEKEWYYYGDNPKWMIKNICQEAGYRMLANLCTSKYSDYDPMLCYQVYEVLSEYMTGKILEEHGIHDLPQITQFDTKALFSIFNTLMDIDPDLSIQDLYGISLETFRRIRPVVSML